MTIISKYNGYCKKCGGKITAGEKIEWSREGGSRHLECQAKAAAKREADPNEIRLHGGSGYGCHGWTVGQVVRTKDKGIVVITSSTKRYYREDGLSFGVGDDQGYLYRATARPATEEEAAPVRAAEAAKAEKKAAKSRLAEIARQIEDTGDAPEEQPVGARAMDTQNVYGGGSWWHLDDPSGIWYVRNNGTDGDDWRHNNVRTGGAGAIGRRIPRDEALIDEIRSLAEKI